jgi:hypothetical protein
LRLKGVKRPSLSVDLDDRRMVMDEEEIIDALINGAIINVSDFGEARIDATDDLPPRVRECIRASRKHDQAHFECPDCLEDVAEFFVLDAGLLSRRRQRGNGSGT